MGKMIFIMGKIVVLPISLVFFLPVNALMGILFFRERPVHKLSLPSKLKFYCRVLIMRLKETLGYQVEESLHERARALTHAAWDFLTLGSWLILILLIEWDKKTQEIESYSSARAAGKR
jgi:hypothetical protein